MESTKKITITVEGENETVQYSLVSNTGYPELKELHEPMIRPESIFRVQRTTPKYFSFETDVLIPLDDAGTLVKIIRTPTEQKEQDK